MIDPHYENPNLLILGPSCVQIFLNICEIEVEAQEEGLDRGEGVGHFGCSSCPWEDQRGRLARAICSDSAARRRPPRREWSSTRPRPLPDTGTLSHVPLGRWREWRRAWGVPHRLGLEHIRFASVFLSFQTGTTHKGSHIWCIPTRPPLRPQKEATQARRTLPKKASAVARFGSML